MHELIYVIYFRFCLPNIVSGDGASVDMFFFSDVACDLVGKPTDVLLDVNYTLLKMKLVFISYQ